ncbi:MAG: SCO family protein, partial [Proteobacteria bacterium]|nr:SCO family protein [Pseudomonadota bacterium]
MKTFKRLALGGALLIAVAAAADTSGLPYYSDKTLTPYWPENQASLPDHRMENFRLSNQLGESFGSSDAEGRIRIVNFFFATCPLTMFNLRRVRDAIEGEEAMLLSFSITANNGFRLYLDGELIVDYWDNPTTDTRRSDPIELIGGTSHSIRMEYYEGVGTAIARLSWASCVRDEQIIPQAALSLPVKANTPSPANGSTGASMTAILPWS